MAFLSQFASYFTAVQRETELYKLWSAIGVNTEKALLEELEAKLAEVSDINTFSADSFRSWLAFFLKRVPYRTTASLGVLVKAPLDASGEITVPSGTSFVSQTGVTYTLLESMKLNPGATQTAIGYQGRYVTERGTYSSLIKVQASNPDLEHLKVYINGNPVPEVSYKTTYDRLHYCGSWTPRVNETNRIYGGTPQITDLVPEQQEDPENPKVFERGQCYNIIESGDNRFSPTAEFRHFRQGDILVYDGVQWGVLNQTNNLNLIENSDEYGIPADGYYAYYYDGFLYIKIYPGNKIDIPDGQEYTVNYLVSDGKLGEITADDPIEFTGTFKDNDGHDVTLTITHDEKSSTASNEPSQGKLGLMLKERFYSSITISSIPEYTAWFRSRPEVGDAIVLSDYEKWVRNGRVGGYEITGEVTVYALDRNGNWLTTDVCNKLARELDKVKDIAFVRIVDYSTGEKNPPVYNAFEVEYFDVTDSLSFQQFVEREISQWYQIDFLQTVDGSLFNSLDISDVTRNILSKSTFNENGFTLRGYHYAEDTNVLVSSLKTFACYDGECNWGGHYEVVFPEDDEHDYEKTYTFSEVQVAAINIGNIMSDDRINVTIGSKSNGRVTISLSEFAELEGYSQDTVVTIRCWWAMSDPGILAIGHASKYRALATTIKPIKFITR